MRRVRRRRATLLVGAVTLVACSSSPASVEPSVSVEAPSTTRRSTPSSTAPRTTTTAPRSTTTTSSSTTTTEASTTTVPAEPVQPPGGGGGGGGGSGGGAGQPLPVWPPYTPLPGVSGGLAALTGLPLDETTAIRPVLAVKIDNQRNGRPQWGLEGADVIFEENVEGVTRFIAVFHSRQPDTIGPVRSARSSDLSILASMNRPLLGWSGGNPGITAAVRDAVAAGVLVDLSALRSGSSGCYRRDSSRRAPHNLVLDPACARNRGTDAGPARIPWLIDANWVPVSPTAPDDTFAVTMDGVRVSWTWDAPTGLYLRSQDGSPHLAASGARIAASNVVELRVPHAPSVIDARSPEAITVGSGYGTLHRDGVAIPITWWRSGPYEAFTFIVLADGTAAALDVGSTFVELERGP
jgi:hypothetical protein